jgi:hypothetical protein
VDAQLFADAAQSFYRELARLARSARIAGTERITGDAGRVAPLAGVSRARVGA